MIPGTPVLRRVHVEQIGEALTIEFDSGIKIAVWEWEVPDFCSQLRNLFPEQFSTLLSMPSEAKY